MIDMIKLAWALQCRFLIWSYWLMPFNIDSFLANAFQYRFVLMVGNYNSGYSLLMRKFQYRLLYFLDTTINPG